MKFKKQIQSMPGSAKTKYWNIIKKIQSAIATSLRGSIYEEKIINLIKQKSKKTKKTISIKEGWKK